MGSKKIAWGILGVAKINSRLYPSFARARNLRLAGIASRSLDKAQAAAKQHGIDKAYGSYEALLDDPEIDVIYNPLPNSMHAEWTRKAADRGKHVLCEKPLTPTAAEAAELVDYCRARKVQLMDGFMWPHHPRTERLKVLIAGVLGRVQKVVGSFSFKMDPLDASNIRLQPQLGGGSLLDVGCYPVYGIRWAFGEEPVRAWAAARYAHGCDVDLHGVLWFAGGRMASFDCGFVHPVRQWLEVTGERATLTVPDAWVPPPRAAYHLRKEGETTVEKHSVSGDQIQCMLEHFSQAVLDQAPAVPSADEAVKTLRVLDALARSAREGKIIDID